MENKIREIPKIQRQPRQASETAIHYGYVAFKDIDLMGPMGIERQVQPEDSPYYVKLPCRELLPFTNVTYAEIDESMASTTSYRTAGLPVIRKQKTAAQCVDEMQAAYEEWGFVNLRPLVGYSEDDAFHIFQTIQPFTYKLVDLLDEVEFKAANRIDLVNPYRVEYNGQFLELEPLPEDLKEAAREVQALIVRSAQVAYDKGSDQREKTVQAMTQYFSTGTGKRRADPLDQYLFDQFNEPIPRLVGKEEGKDSSAGLLEKLADALTGRQRNEELEKELAEVKQLKEQLKAVVAQPATIEAAPKTVSVGDAVVVGGQEAVVTAKPFGKVKVQFTDGSFRTVAKDEIT